MRSWARAALLGAVGAAELLVSAVVHLGYAFYIFGTAVIADVSASLVKALMAAGGGGVAKGVAVEGEDEAAAVLDGAVPPIVLVHGIFGFGKGVRTFHSFCSDGCSAFVSFVVSGHRLTGRKFVCMH
jgi:hypothetical protein